MGQKTRFLKITKKSALLCLLGVGYAFFVLWTGIAVPCPLHTVTGLYCPSCGVSRMCLSLLRLDLPGAWHANVMLLLLLPLFAGVFLSWAVRYIKTGNRNLLRWQTAVIWSCCVLLLIFGILRNVPWFAFLAPQ